MAYEVIPVSSGLWAIQDGNVRMYLLDGGEEALLIDTGYGSGELLQVVTELVKGKVSVVFTHSHGDHTSGAKQFQHFYISKADLPEITPCCPKGSKIETVEDGSIIKAGSVQLEVISIPGHTPGAIALLDREHRVLFSGDTFAKNYPIYMQFQGQSLENYLISMQKLKGLSNMFDRICPCHGELKIEKEYIDRTIGCCRKILDGTVEVGTAPLADGTPARAGRFEEVAIFF